MTNSYLHWFKLIFVFGKVIVICLMMIAAIRARLRKNGKHDQLTYMFIAFIIILMSLIAFDLGTKYIWGFYLLVFFSNYINFLGLNYLVRKLNSPERKILRRRTNFYFMLMNLLYMFNFVMTFTESFGPWCTKTHLYP